MKATRLRDCVSPACDRKSRLKKNVSLPEKHLTRFGVDREIAQLTIAKTAPSSHRMPYARRCLQDVAISPSVCGNRFQEHRRVAETAMLQRDHAHQTS